jgi:hypothetical protein
VEIGFENLKLAPRHRIPRRVHPFRGDGIERREMSETFIKAARLRHRSDGVEAPSKVSIAAPQAHRIVGRDRLSWRPDANGLVLYYGRARRALVRIVPDATWAGMFRARLPDGQISDMANLPRIKDAAFAIALRYLNSDPQETARKGTPVRQTLAGVRGVGSGAITLFGKADETQSGSR